MNDKNKILKKIKKTIQFKKNIRIISIKQLNK
jgi:hypothetical protein